MALDVEQTIRDHWSLRHMSFSTVDQNGRPTTTELDFAAHPSGLLLCYRTLATRAAGRNVTGNPNVSGNIVREHAIGQKAVTEVGFTGAAELLSAGSLREEFAELYAAKLGGTTVTLLERANDPDGFQFYGVEISDWTVYAPPQEGEKPITHHFQFP